MAARHQSALKNLLETVAFEGFAAATKEFFVRAYGRGQRRFTKAVRDHVQETWNELRAEILEETPSLKVPEELGLRFALTPTGKVLVVRDDIWWTESEEA